MKKILKYLFAFILAVSARMVVRRYRPRIIMVTGSVGKTSTKDAIATVLSSRFFVRKSEKSFNSEFGVPFTILGVANPWDNPFAWASLMKSSLALLVLPNHYPTMLVLEVGADRPGDIARILRIATPDVVVVTHLPEVPVHVEAYTSPEAVREEEFSPAYALPVHAPLIVSSDDAYALAHAEHIGAHVVSYGVSAMGTVRVSQVDFYEKEGKTVGMFGQITLLDEQGNFKVMGSVGKTQICPIAAAIATAHACNIPLIEALTALEGYVPPPGRGRLFAGKNNSVIIDDSYNASPIAVEKALETLQAFPHALRRIAVLGDMLELGRYSVEEHAHIGARARESADIVVAVGIRARAYALAEGRAEVVLFDTAHAASLALVDMVRAGDVILVKGSQSVRTERIVKALLADPADVARLVRQDGKWGEKV